MKIMVGTENNDKIIGTAQAFRAIFGRSVQIEGRPSPSNVPNQPTKESESRAGAYNRAHNLFCNHPGYDYYVGIESGLKPSTRNGGMYIMRDWACIINMTGQKSEGSGGGSYLPRSVCQLIADGLSLSNAMRRVFSDYDDIGGALSYLTNGAIERKKEVYDAVIKALIPFKYSEQYSEYLSNV